MIWRYFQPPKVYQQDILIENNIFPETYLYEKYQIDSLQLVESKVYYASRPDVYLKIFKEVEGRLNAQKEAMEKEQALQVRNLIWIKIIRRKNQTVFYLLRNWARGREIP